MAQTRITTYFGKRKRIIGDEPDLKAKKLLLDDNPRLLKYTRKKVFEGIEAEERNETVVVGTNTSQRKDECSTVSINSFENNKAFEEPITPSTGDNPVSRSERNAVLTSPVKFQLMGPLSTAKKLSLQSSSLPERSSINKIRKEIIPKTPEKQITVLNHQTKPQAKEAMPVRSSSNKCTTDDVIQSAKALVDRIKETQKQVRAGEKEQKKELSLKEVKDKLKQSAKLNELKKSINKINEQAAVLIELENRKKENSVPKLSKFKAIEVDVPISPQKSALFSPSKVERSPAKPAYERFNFLTEAGSTLPLPLAFQKLYELFRAVDTICSMMLNRGEDITFNKLKPAVQEMTRRTFTLRHLGQIAAVSPQAFSFHQEKVRNFGSTSKSDRYELVITPTFPQNSHLSLPNDMEKEDIFHLPDKMLMTPKIIKARREVFYKALLEITKDCHEEFLKSLDPPMHINRNDLKRWHPNFMVDHVPDIVPKELPQAPNSERPATAKEVLERAKDFLSSNARLQKALESASQPSEGGRDITSGISPEIKEKVDSRLNNPLKGISKSLLERVRARQAAKALDSMRMTPLQEKETVMYTRLPSIARIVRTLFVNEQRGVLSWDIILEKVQFSYNRNIGKGEVDKHVKLLMELLPEWLSIVHIRNGNYLKMNPAADLTAVMNKLDKIVGEKTKNS